MMDLQQTEKDKKYRTVPYPTVLSTSDQLDDRQTDGSTKLENPPR